MEMSTSPFMIRIAVLVAATHTPHNSECRHSQYCSGRIHLLQAFSQFLAGSQSAITKRLAVLRRESHAAALLK
jgi:hypothetical protein